MGDLDQMTFGEAKSRLRKYYRVIELVADTGLKSTDILIAVCVGNDPFPVGPQAKEVIRRVDLEASVRDVKEALERLPEDYQVFLERRYGQEMSLRVAGPEGFISKSSAQRYEVEVQSALVAAMGKIPVGE